MPYPPSSEAGSHHLRYFNISMCGIAHSSELEAYYLILLLFYGGNMVLLINDLHINYCHMDAIISILLGGSYFENPESFAVKVWVSVTIDHLNTAILTGPNIYNCTRFFLG